jgi:hypothetical protein
LRIVIAFLRVKLNFVRHIHFPNFFCNTNKKLLTRYYRAFYRVFRVFGLFYEVNSFFLVQECKSCSKITLTSFYAYFSRFWDLLMSFTLMFSFFWSTNIYSTQAYCRTFCSVYRGSIEVFGLFVLKSHFLVKIQKSALKINQWCSIAHVYCQNTS